MVAKTTTSLAAAVVSLRGIFLETNTTSPTAAVSCAAYLCANKDGKAVSCCLFLSTYLTLCK